MAHRDQKKYIENLKRYENKMDQNERYNYKMYVKRHKDDEDLDKLSMEKLRKMYEKYHVNRERKNFDHFFKSDD